MHVVRYCIACDVWDGTKIWFCEFCAHLSWPWNNLRRASHWGAACDATHHPAHHRVSTGHIGVFVSSNVSVFSPWWNWCLKLCKTVWNSAAHGFLSHLSTSTWVKFHHQGLSTPTEVVVAETVDLSPMLKTSSATKCQDVSGCVTNLKQYCGCLGRLCFSVKSKLGGAAHAHDSTSTCHVGGLPVVSILSSASQHQTTLSIEILTSWCKPNDQLWSNTVRDSHVQCRLSKGCFRFKIFKMFWGSRWVGLEMFQSQVLSLRSAA